MPFIVILVLSALLIAGAAAFFSVYGLAQVFAGAFISVVVMGVALEVGKLVAASFLYRFWDKISLGLKTYLMVAVLALMGITSMGISGYLTAAYQTDTVGLRDASDKLASHTAELDRLIARKADMDRQISQLPPDYVAARQKLMQSFKSEYATMNPRIELLQAEKSKLQEQKITTEAKVGPIVFISRVLGSETDDAIFWLVVLIVCVFDPLAVALTIAANIAIADRKSQKAQLITPETMAAAPPEPTATVTVAVAKSPSTSVAVKAALNVPELAKEWLGLWSAETSPSPKSHE